MFFSFLNSLFGFTLVVLNKQSKLMFINAACVVFNLVGNLILIPYWGFRAAGLTSILCELFILISTFLSVRNVLHINLDFTTVSKIALSSAVMGLFVTFGFHWLTNLWFLYQLAILVPMGALVYLGMMLWTRAVNDEMREILRKKS